MKKYIYLSLFIFSIAGIFLFYKYSFSQTDNSSLGGIDSIVGSSQDTLSSQNDINFTTTNESLDNTADITLSYQTLDSYIPPFYEGKALPGEESYSKAVAFVDVNTSAGTLNSSKFFYEWYYNDYLIDTYSKVGGNTIFFTLDKTKNNNNLKLIVYTDNSRSQKLGEKKISISPYKSPLPLYRQDSNPLITYANAINKKYTSYSVATGENFSILVEPLFFSIKNPLDTSISYSWGENGVAGTNGNYTNNYNYTAPNNFDTTPSISLDVSNNNSDKILQTDNTLVNFILK